MLSNSSILCFHLGNTKWYLLLVFTSVTVYAGHLACSLSMLYIIALISFLWAWICSIPVINVLHWKHFKIELLEQPNGWWWKTSIFSPYVLLCYTPAVDIIGVVPGLSLHSTLPDARVDTPNGYDASTVGSSHSSSQRSQSSSAGWAFQNSLRPGDRGPGSFKTQVCLSRILKLLVLFVSQLIENNNKRWSRFAHLNFFNFISSSITYLTAIPTLCWKDFPW